MSLRPRILITGAAGNLGSQLARHLIPGGHDLRLLEAGVERIVLLSFPQVEGATSVEAPAIGRLDRQPVSVHARTRLEEERLLLERTEGTSTTPIVLRCGTV